MKTFLIHRAQGVHDDGANEVTIHIQHVMPNVPTADARRFFASEGAALAEAIWTSCPGGTVDALITALLVRRMEARGVPLPEPTPATPEAATS